MSVNNTLATSSKSPLIVSANPQCAGGTALHGISRRIVHVRVRGGVACVGRYRNYRTDLPVTAIHTIVYSFNRHAGILSYGATTFRKNSVRHDVQIERTVSVRGIPTVIRKTVKTGHTWTRSDHVSTAMTRHDVCPVLIQFPICNDPDKFLDTDEVEEYIVDHLDEFGRQSDKSRPEIIHTGGTVWSYRDALPRTAAAALPSQPDPATTKPVNSNDYSNNDAVTTAMIEMGTTAVAIGGTVASVVSGYHWVASVLQGVGVYVVANALVGRFYM